MARPHQDQSDPRVQTQWIMEGRGTGRNGQFIPWLKMQDFASRGKCRRLIGHITGDRVVHLFSNHEARAFFILEASFPLVTDIREQFPLLPLEETLAIAKELGVEHPGNRATGRPIVMTTDLLVSTGQETEEKHCAIAIKEAKELSSWRHCEKLQIARVYHERHGHSWWIVTERDIPMELARNLEILREKRDLDGFGGVPLATRTLVEQVLLPLIWKGDLSVAGATADCDRRLGLSPGTSLSVAYHLIYLRHWTTDLTKILEPSRPLTLLTPQPKDINEIFKKLPGSMA